MLHNQIGGGEGSAYYNDVWIFDTHTMSYSKPEVYGPLPPARRAHAAVLWRDSIVVFGGGDGNRALNDTHVLSLKNPDKLEWSEMHTNGRKPTERGYHSLNLVNNTAVCFGGSDGKSSFCDVHALDLGESHLSNCYRCPDEAVLQRRRPGVN